MEILNEDGTMARLPELMKVAEKFDLNFIENNTIKNLTIEDGLIPDMFHSESNPPTRLPGARRVRALSSLVLLSSFIAAYI